MNKLASPTPLYHRIYTVLRERIINGYYPADLPVPSEAELAQSFGVSRITIRKAMKILSDEGLVTRARGRGTFVTDHSQQHRLNRAVVSNINGLFNYLNTVGLSTTLRVISIDKSEAPPRIAVLMGVAPDAQIVRSVRVRDLDGRPYSLSIAYLLPEIGSAIQEDDLAQNNMIDLVQQAGARVDQVEQVLTATLADDYAAQHLQVPVGAALMRMIRVFVDARLGSFYVAEILYCADRYEYRVALRREPGQDFILDDIQSG